jgi:hypothetical protein
MIEATKQRIGEWKEKYEQQGKEFDFVLEISDLMEKISLECIFGLDINTVKLDYEEKG